MTVPIDRPSEEHAAERSRRIELSVARQVARRQRLIRLYLVLLVVPLGVAVGFLVWGRTDRQVVEDEVNQRVKPVEQRYQEIAPMLDEVRGVGELLPEIRDVGQRFQGYERGQSELSEQVAEVATEVSRLKPAVEEAREAKAEVQALRHDYEVQQREVVRRFEVLDSRIGPATEGAGLGPPPNREGAIFSALEGRTARVEQQQAELSRRLERLAASPSGASSDPAETRLLKRQIAALERSVATLEREVDALRSELDRYRQPR